MKKGDKIELSVSKYVFEGKGLAKIERDDNGKTGLYTIFVNGGYPGDEVIAEFTAIKKSYAETRVAEVLKPSPIRTKPRCIHFGVCGGCKQQDMDYGAQAMYKQEQVKEIFERLGGFNEFEMLDIEKSEHIFYYRNKMEFSFADKRWLSKEEMNRNENIDNSFALGLHIPRMFDKVLDVTECYLQSETSAGIVNFTRDFFKAKNSTIYSTKTHSGYLRNLIIKLSRKYNQLMVNLVTSEDNEEMMREYSAELLKRFPDITTIVNNVNLKKSQTALGDFEKTYYGNGFIYDSIGGYKFRVSANSFFQTNTLQAEHLYQVALDFAGLKGNETVYDLYSGAGTISIFVSDKAGKVYAFESVQPAVDDAEENKKENNINNVFFYTADLNKSFLNKLKEESVPSPEVVIVDPPRSGMNPVTVQDLIKLSPEKIVYISCNPATQARDIKTLTENGYALIKMKPVDMFPHTYHIENVALIVRLSK